MLRMFLQWFQVFSGVFASVSMYVSSVLSAFRRMLQVLHLNISKVNWVLLKEYGFQFSVSRTNYLEINPSY
jgi:hypothetical protein